MRCSALAAEFRSQGWQTSLWSASPLDLLPPFVRQDFETVAAQPPAKSELLVVDEMYSSDDTLAEHVAAWRRQGGLGPTVGIDDMQVRSMSAFDVVVNAELGLETASYQASQVLLGERFALLRPGFSRPACLEPWPLPESVVSVLVMLGGTDAFGCSEKALRALFQWGATRVAPVLVLAEGSPNRNKTLDTLARFSRHRLLSNQDASQLAAWMRRCSFAILACGSSVYEAAAMQLPFLGLCLVDNQRATARKLQALWNLPVIDCESRPIVANELQPALDTLSVWPKSAYSNVDAAGPRRILEALLQA